MQSKSLGTNVKNVYNALVKVKLLGYYACIVSGL